MISGEMKWILDEGTWVTWRRLSLVKICFNVEGEEASKDRCLLCESIRGYEASSGRWRDG